jgi:hypothetical protein
VKLITSILAAAFTDRGPPYLPIDQPDAAVLYTNHVIPIAAIDAAMAGLDCNLTMFNTAVGVKVCEYKNKIGKQGSIGLMNRIFGFFGFPKAETSKVRSAEDGVLVKYKMSQKKLNDMVTLCIHLKGDFQCVMEAALIRYENIDYDGEL